LGELSPEDAVLVERALATSPETRACLEQIRKPIALRPLPDTPSRKGRPTLVSALRARWPLLSLAATLAGIALLVWVRARPGQVVFPARSVRVKGGDVVLALVRERVGAIDTAPSTFAEGDRFKVLLTCPPDFDGSFDVAVLQEGTASFPFPAPASVSCGNAVPLLGAFTLTGSASATVCVTWGGYPNERRTIEQHGIESVRQSAACTTLAPE
jgi:hypothetical protein